MSQTLQCEEVEALCRAAENMLEAANQLWTAHNPDDAPDGVSVLSVDDAQEAHSSAFKSLHRAIYYARKHMTPNAK